MQWIHAKSMFLDGKKGGYKMNYYEQYKERYAAADEKTRKASREHWQRVHAENLASGRQDLIIFSAQILAMICVVEQ